MAAHVKGRQIEWTGQRDAEGHRTYKITWLLLTDSPDDGPFTVMECTDLPASGSAWAFGNDFDQWAWCRADLGIRRWQPKGGERHTWWTAEQTFSTKPPDPSKQRCQDVPIEDPLLEPAKVSGGGVKYTEEATEDRFGQPLMNSALEQIRGPKVQFDANRNTIKIEQNVGTYNDILLAEQMRDTVNRLPIWGKPYRCVKLSGVDFVRQFWQQCIIYFKRTLTFDVDMRLDRGTGQYVSGFDRDLVDEGTLVLSGQWDASGSNANWVLKEIMGYAGTPNPNPSIPHHFIRFKGRDNQARSIILNGAGLPAGVGIINPGEDYVSIQNGNVGNDVGNQTWWLAVIFPAVLTSISLWRNDIAYGVGELVNFPNFPGDGSDRIYVATGEPGESNFNISPVSVLGPAFWTHLTGISLPRNRGAYNSGTTYAIGDVVTATNTTEPGNIHIEVYNESDFTLLGIPLDFSVP